MSPEDTTNRPDGEKYKRELILPDKNAEATKRMGGDPTTDAPAPLMTKDKGKGNEDKSTNNKQDNKPESKETKQD
jgi:hypothetical protein